METYLERLESDAVRFFASKLERANFSMGPRMSAITRFPMGKTENHWESGKFPTAEFSDDRNPKRFNFKIPEGIDASPLFKSSVSTGDFLLSLGMSKAAEFVFSVLRAGSTRYGYFQEKAESVECVLSFVNGIKKGGG